MVQTNNVMYKIKLDVQIFQRIDERKSVVKNVANIITNLMHKTPIKCLLCQQIIGNSILFQLSLQVSTPYVSLKKIHSPF